MRRREIPHRQLSRPGLIVAALGLVLILTEPVQALNLAQSYQLALQQDAGYQAARADAAANRETIPMAFAQLLPSLSSNLARNKSDTSSAVPGFLGATVNNSYDYMSSSYALVLRQPVYRKYNFAQYQQAQSQVASAEASLDRSRQDLLVRLSGAYFEALMAQDQVALVMVQKEAYVAQLQAAQRLFAAGQGTRTDIDDAQARYDMVLAQELEARQNIGHTRRLLQVIINQPVEHLASLNPARMQLTAPLPADPEDWIARGEEVNAELRAMRANTESSRQEVEKARAGHMPTVDLVAQRSRNNSANDTTIHQLYLTSQIGLQVNIPIYSGGYVNASVRQALANLDKYQQQYEAKRREIGVQIRKEFQSVTEGVLKVKALEQAERSSDQAVFSNQKGYQAGTRTLIDILNAQQQRMNVRRDLAQSRYQYLMARVRLQGLVGSLDEEEIGLINSWLSEAGENDKN